MAQSQKLCRHLINPICAVLLNFNLTKNIMIKKYSNSRFIKNITSLRFDLAIIFIVAISSIILIEFWLINIPEFFSGGAKIGQIILRLCFAYVSAFIFYFLVVHLKSQKDKENLYNYISNKTLMVIGHAKSLIISSAKAANVSLKVDYPDKTELNAICKAINPNSKAPLLLDKLGNYANWIQYFDHYKRQSNDAIDKILSKMQYLDSELVYKLANIEDCIHFQVISIVKVKVTIKNKDLTGFELSLANYFELIKDLDKYYNKKLKDFK